MKRLRTYFLTGILVTAPASITLYVAWLFITFVDEKVTALLPEAYNPNLYIPYGIPGIGLLLLMVSLTLIGAFAAGFFGRILGTIGEFFLSKMPIVRGMYGALKQIFTTVLSDQSTAFREVVLFEYPRKDIWIIGFITGTTGKEIKEKIKKDLVNVYVPTTPNPTSGFLIFMPKEDLISLSISVEDAMKLIISGGIVNNEHQALKNKNE